MIFPYTKVIDFPRHKRRDRLLPWIRFGIFNPKDETKIVYPLGLIDSGSDITIINHEFAQALGLDIKKGRKDTVYGIGGGKMSVYSHEIGFLIHDGSEEKPIKYRDFAAFTLGDFPVSMPQQTAILGTIGFFRHLKVTFNFPENVLIEPLPHLEKGTRERQ